MSRDLGKDLTELLALLMKQGLARMKAGDPDIKGLVAILERSRKYLARRPAEASKQKALAGLLEEGVGVLLDRVAEEQETMNGKAQLAIWDLAERCVRKHGQINGAEPEEGSAISEIRRKLHKALKVDAPN